MTLIFFFFFGAVTISSSTKNNSNNNQNNKTFEWIYFHGHENKSFMETNFHKFLSKLQNSRKALYAKINFAKFNLRKN